MRKITVSKKTYRCDASLLRLMPTSMQALRVADVSDRDVGKAFETLLATDLRYGSVVRFRASLSPFFGWCVREKLIRTNPVTGVPVPKSSEEQTEMWPWDEDGLEAAYQTWRGHNAHLADVFLILGWTGLRWGEARALTVDDIVQVPTPGLLVRRSAPESVATKATKGRRSRRVPVADRVLPLIRQLANNAEPGQPLLTGPRGGLLHRTPTVRALQWDITSQGRRIHDLRHTAACLWLARGVDPATVQAWMGHESLATTNRYIHYLGTTADVAGLDKLNSSTHGGDRARSAAQRSA